MTQFSSKNIITLKVMLNPTKDATYLMLWEGEINPYCNHYYSGSPTSFSLTIRFGQGYQMIFLLNVQQISI